METITRINNLLKKHGYAKIENENLHTDVLLRFMHAVLDELEIMHETRDAFHDIHANGCPHRMH